MDDLLIAALAVHGATLLANAVGIFTFFEANPDADYKWYVLPSHD